jgi:TrmH family RNA methyltransferase
VDSQLETPEIQAPTAAAAPITSRQNSHVRQLRAAFTGNRRLSHGLVAIEGGHLIAEALRSGVKLESIYISQTASQKHAAESGFLRKHAAQNHATPIFVLSDDVFRSAAGTETPQGIAALINPPRHGLRALCDRTNPAPIFLALEALQDPGNLGTLIRSAEAFGAAGIITLPGTVSPWNQKSLRASAGSVFRLKVVGTQAEGLAEFAKDGLKIFAAVAKGGTPVHLVDLRQPSILLIGNEGAGLSPQVLALAQERITLSTPGPVESLNAAVAGSLLLYEAARQRGAAAAATGPQVDAAVAETVPTDPEYLI